jgi:hypothetical protein
MVWNFPVNVLFRNLAVAVKPEGELSKLYIIVAVPSGLTAPVRIVGAPCLPLTVPAIEFSVIFNLTVKIPQSPASGAVPTQLPS